MSAFSSLLRTSSPVSSSFRNVPFRRGGVRYFSSSRIPNPSFQRCLCQVDPDLSKPKEMVSFSSPFSTSVVHRCRKTEDAEHEEKISSKDDDEESDGEGFQADQVEGSGKSSRPQKNTEDITTRLRRLSQTPPDKFVPSQTPEEIESVKAQFQEVLEDFDSKFYRDEVMRQRNPNYRPSNNRGRGGFGGGGRGGRWGGGRGGNNNWRDHSNDWGQMEYQQRRELSTMVSAAYKHAHAPTPTVFRDNVNPSDEVEHKSKKSWGREKDGVKDVDPSILIRRTAGGEELPDHDADTFGTLSIGSARVKDYAGAAVKQELMKDELEFGLSGVDEAEEDDMLVTPLEHKDKWNSKKLGIVIKQLIQEMKTKEAIDTLNSALEQGGFHFDTHDLQYCYNLCISGCGNVGYVKMAFQLFRQMQIRGIPPRVSTCTSLFNVCANSVWDAEGNIERMNKLREAMPRKGLFPDQSCYHAMIKGYGRNGDIEAAFSIVDEMTGARDDEEVNLRFQPNTETFNMLLQACISNTNNGFRHMLVTWRKMRNMRIRPDIYSYNLLARGIRECGILPDPEMLEIERELKASKLLPPPHPNTASSHTSLPGPGPSSSGQNKASNRNNKSSNIVPFAENSREKQPPLKFPLITSPDDSNDMIKLLCLKNESYALTTFNQRLHENNTLPSQAYSYSSIIEALNDEPENRLAVFGGLPGFTSQMAEDDVKPNLKTITELGQLIDPLDIGDLSLIMKRYNLNPDVVFFNMMMKRSIDSGKLFSAKMLLPAMAQSGISPNIMTWGVLARGCKTKKEAEQFLSEMDIANFIPNIQIMGCLLQQAVNSFNPFFVVWVMCETKKREVAEDVKFMLELETFKRTVRRGIIGEEMGKQIFPPNLQEALTSHRPAFNEGWMRFMSYYKDWMKNTNIKIQQKDPWEKDFEKYKKFKSHGTLENDSSQ